MIKSTERHLDFLYLKDYKTWGNSYVMCSKMTMLVFLFVSTFAVYVQIITMQLLAGQSSERSHA